MASRGRFFIGRTASWRTCSPHEATARDKRVDANDRNGAGGLAYGSSRRPGRLEFTRRSTPRSITLANGFGARAAV
jgi:hypothetical protein